MTRHTCTLVHFPALNSVVLFYAAGLRDTVPSTIKSNQIKHIVGHKIQMLTFEAVYLFSQYDT